MNKTVLLATFILSDKLNSFLKFIELNLNINKESVFIYTNLTDKSKLIITFKFNIIQDEKLNLKEFLYNTIVIHKKGNAFYTINALNKLIESKNNNYVGNIDYKSIIIDWSEYQNKIMLTKNKDLIIFDIKRIF